MRKVGLLAISIVAFVVTVSAVPRYSAPVPQVGDSPRFAEATTQNPSAPVLQRITQEAQMCTSPQPYVTCAYMRPLDAPVVGKVAEATLGEKGVHWQIVIYNAKTGEQIASYGKTTSPIVQGSSVAGLVVAGAVGAIAGALEGTAYGQGIMTHDDPTNNPEYATYRQEPVWCIGSSEISVLKPGYYEVLDTDCREYAERVKDDLLRNKGGREIPAPEYTILSTSCRKGDMSKRETESTSRSNDVSDDSEKRSVVPEKKTVSNRVDVANSTSPATADSDVGVRGWCKCPNRSANIVTGPLFRMGEDFNVADYSYFFCGDCYKCRKDFNDVADIIKDGTICIWDVKVARANGLDGKTIPDVKAQQQLSEAQDRIMQIPDGEVVIPGLCRCESPRIWLFGELPKRIEMCKDCGRPRSPIPLSAKNPRQPRKLRRCRKTSTSIFVCTCAGDTGVKPNIHASPYDDGDVELSLVCTKCSQVKYSAFVPVREFKKKFANGKPDPQAMLVYMIGTVDIKAAMLAADKEASSQN